MNVVGPHWARLLLNAFVVVVGFLILSGAVNTAIIGSNGVLNRVAEDGVLPDWFLKPHPQLRHDLPPAEPDRRLAAGHDRRQPGQRAASWARRTPSAWSGASCSRRCRWWCCASSGRGRREYKVPLNIRVGGVEHAARPGLIFLVLLLAARRQPVDQGGGDHRRADLHRGLLHRLHRSREQVTTRTRRRGRAARAPRAVQPGARRAGHAPQAWA